MAHLENHSLITGQAAMQAAIRSCEHSGESRLTAFQRLATQIVSVQLDEVKRPHEHRGIVVPVADVLEQCDAVLAARHCLAVEDAGACA